MKTRIPGKLPALGLNIALCSGMGLLLSLLTRCGVGLKSISDSQGNGFNQSQGGNSNSASEPSAFGFTSQTGVATGATITSNTFTLSGGFTDLTATCQSGCIGISRNGSAFTSGPVTGFNSGDTIAIELTSSSSYSTQVTTTVTVGTTTSSSWSVTTEGDPCAGTPSVGAVCADGSVYAGLTPDGNVAMYATASDAASTYEWETYDYETTNVNNSDTGQSNTSTLLGLNSGQYGQFQAAAYCHDLTLNGHSDWYLPAYQELHVLYENQAAIGGFTSNDWYWSSTESSSNSAAQAYALQFSSNSELSTDKAGAYNVRCVRK